MPNIKKTPSINAASMADISFIILIFFLMVTTMGSEFGLVRMLPPWVDPNDKNTDEINKRNVLVVSVNQQNAIMVNNVYLEISELKAKAKEFYDITTTGDNFPEKIEKELPLLGSIVANKTAVVSLQNDRSTSYKTYIQVQNELAAAVNELRNEFSMQRFGKKYDECSKEQQDVVGKEVYPMSISEAEPRDIGKTKGKK